MENENHFSRPGKVMENGQKYIKSWKMELNVIKIALMVMKKSWNFDTEKQWEPWNILIVIVTLTFCLHDLDLILQKRLMTTWHSSNILSASMTL